MIVAVITITVIFSFCTPAVSVKSDKSEEARTALRLFVISNMLNDYRKRNPNSWPPTLKDLAYGHLTVREIERFKPDSTIYNPPPTTFTNLPSNWILLAASTDKETIVCSLDGKITRLRK